MSYIVTACMATSHTLDWLQSLKHFFNNVSYHILVASLTLMALSTHTSTSIGRTDRQRQNYILLSCAGDKDKNNTMSMRKGKDKSKTKNRTDPFRHTSTEWHLP